MATPETMSFHNANALSERERVRLRIQQGTKASSPDIRSYRRQHLQIYQPHATLADNSTGSKNRPFYATKDESHISLEDKVRMRGGVLSTPEGQKYAQFILKRRARDTTKQELEAQGIEPSTVFPEGADLTLTPDESKSLELNNLLQGISDAVNAGDFSGLTITELKNIPRLMITTLPKMSQSNFTELVRFIEELLEELEAIIEPKEDEDDDDATGAMSRGNKTVSGAERIFNFLEIIVIMLRQFAKVIGADEATKTATLKALVNEYFGLRKSTAESILQKPEQKRVVDLRSGQPIAPGEQRAPAQKPPARRRLPVAPRAPPPVPRSNAVEAKVEDEEAPRAEAPRRAPRLTEEQRAFEAQMEVAYKLAKSKVDGKRQQGLARLAEGARALGKRVPADAMGSRTKLKNLIEKDTPFILG